jgi:photosystem II stability/assembly factor-like uncharacterized protein
MRIPRISYLLLAGSLSLFAQSDVRAQWVNIAPNLLGDLSIGGSFGGSSCFKDGFLWFGKNSLWVSADTGKTWSDASPPLTTSNEVILSIDFLDRFNGIVLTADKLFITGDGGFTWTKITPPFNNLICAFFIGSPLNIGVGYQNGLMISSDGGSTFAQSWVTDPVTDGHGTGGGTASVIAVSNPECRLYTTSDNGANWQPTDGAAFYDCWSFDFDKCDTNVIYLVNDAAQTSNDGKSHLFVSTNRGSSWTISKTAATDTKHFNSYLCGSVSSAVIATYAQTSTDGVIRTTDKGGFWKSIGGPSSGSDTRFVQAIDDNTVFAVDHAGSIWETTNSGGEGSLSRPTNGTVLTSQNSLFDNDTLHCTTTFSRTIAFIRTGCHNPSIRKYKLIGLDSTSFQLGNPSYDSLQVIFTPTHNGANSASLIILLDDGSADTVQLKGWGDNIPFTYSFIPKSLFTGDTLSLCNQPLTKTFVLKTFGCKPKIVSQGISGSAQKDYTIVQAAQDPFTGSDTIIVTFKPGAGYLRDASYDIALGNGTTISIPLEGVGKVIPFTYSLQPSSLFGNDSLFICSSSVQEKAFVTFGGCPRPSIISETISGNAANDYNFAKKLSGLLGDVDSLAINFKPTTAGSRSAACTITFSDGTVISIPLNGYVIPTQEIIRITSAESTDTLGGDIKVPIAFSGLYQPEDIELVVHYSNQLEYKGSFTSSKISVDMPGEQWVGRSKLHFTGARSNVYIGYSQFNAFNDSLSGSTVSFDSLNILTSVSPCQYILPQRASIDTVAPPSSCGIDILSRFLHHGILPQLDVIPNPTDGNVSIVSTSDLGDARIEVYDMMGIRRSQAAITLAKDDPAKIVLPASSGVYTIRVIHGSGIVNMQVIESR